MLKLWNMIQNKYFNFSTVIFLLTGSFAWSQFVEVNAELDMRRLSEGDRQLFDTMAEDIENYYINTQFSADVNDLEMVIDIRLVLESVSRGGSQTTINAQAIFSNKMDQYFYAKGVQFPYSRGQKMQYPSMRWVLRRSVALSANREQKAGIPLTAGTTPLRAYHRLRVYQALGLAGPASAAPAHPSR